MAVHPSAQDIEVGYQTFVSDGGEEFGAVRAVTPDFVLVWVENAGEFRVPVAAVQAVHSHVRSAMDAGGARLDGIYVCVHHPSVGPPPYRQDCDCRKPRPGLLRQAETEIGADLARSWMIGDRHGDLAVAWAVGARAALVKTGYGLGELTWHAARWPRAPDLVAENVLEAVERILSAPEDAA